MHLGMRWQHHATDLKRSIQAHSVFAEALEPPAMQMKIIRDYGFAIDIYRADLSQNLSARGHSAASFASGAHFHQRRADRSSHGAFDEGHALIVDQHHACERGDRRSVVDAVFQR